VLGGQAMGKTAGVPVAVKVDTASSGKQANRRCSNWRFPIGGGKNLISHRLIFD
jgi:hypothetical protein